MNPLWLLLIVPASIAVGVFGAYYANTYRGMGNVIVTEDGNDLKKDS